LERRSLHPHPAELPSAPFSLDVAVRAGAERLQLSFRLTGPIEQLRVPSPSAPARRDNLWQHTCFEAFLSLDGGYLEFNLSPSTQWAAYCFSGYRAGMSELEVAAPGIAVSRTDCLLELDADLALPAGLVSRRLGLSAVIEDVSGRKSYWALVHPPGGRPDFHHADCFALELPPASHS
ncbi:MAG TPA: DOMON-like domain-containing protein, partial [Sphingomonas sp.]|nr:DOMON-like domain-containing protein [Sphingomonas sp.]